MTARRSFEWAIVVGIALALHVAAFLRIPSGAVGDAGAEGTASVSLQAMTPHLAAMIARVDLADEVTTPEAVEALAAPTAVAPDAPQVEASGSAARPETVALNPSRATPDSVPVPVQVAEPSRPPPATATGVPAASAEAAAAIALAPPDAVDADALGPVQTAALAPVVAASPPPLAEARTRLDAQRTGPSPAISANQSPVAIPRSVEPAQASQPIAASPPAPTVSQSVPAPLAPPDPRSETPIAPAEARSALAPEASPQPPRRPQSRRAQSSPVPSPREQAADTPRAAQSAPASAEATSQQAAPREQAQQRAQGSGGGAQAGTARAGTPSISEAQRSSLMARWGGQIRSRIERRKPSGSVGRGTVTLRISIANDGRLAGVAVARSSGNAGLDTAAVQAVQRAGRFPRAPRGLPSGPHAFTLPVQFTR